MNKSAAIPKAKESKDDRAVGWGILRQNAILKRVMHARLRGDAAVHHVEFCGYLQLVLQQRRLALRDVRLRHPVTAKHANRVRKW